MANDDAWSLESESDSPSWIEEFCDVRGHEFFCHVGLLKLADWTVTQVEKSWVEDRFNLHGLNKLPHFDDARSVILDRYVHYPVNTFSLNQRVQCLFRQRRGSHRESCQSLVWADSRSFYYHRAVSTVAQYTLVFNGKFRGMSHMLAKFKNGEFGKCPRVFCNGQSMLPIGNTREFVLRCSVGWVVW